MAGSRVVLGSLGTLATLRQPLEALDLRAGPGPGVPGPRPAVAAAAVAAAAVLWQTFACRLLPRLIKTAISGFLSTSAM